MSGLFPPVSDEEELAQFAVLHDKWKQPLYDKFMELGGFYYKSGQKIASNQGGVVPKAYVDKVRRVLTSDVYMSPLALGSVRDV